MAQRFTYLKDTDAGSLPLWAWAKKLVDDLNIYVAKAATVPPGVRAAWHVGKPAPSGWLLEQAQSLAVPSYPALFTVIEYEYGGSGDFFNLPPAGATPTIIKT